MSSNRTVIKLKLTISYSTFRCKKDIPTNVVQTELIRLSLADDSPTSLVPTYRHKMDNVCRKSSTKVCFYWAVDIL